MKKKVLLCAGILFCMALSGLSADWSGYVDMRSYKVNDVESLQNLQSAFLKTHENGFGIIIKLKNNAQLYWNFTFSNFTQEGSQKFKANLNGSVQGIDGNWYHGWSGTFLSASSFGSQLETMVVSGNIQGQYTKVLLQWRAK
jgi:hypothetical protein